MIAKNVITLLNSIENKQKQVRVRLIEKINGNVKIKFADILTAVRFCNNLFICISAIDSNSYMNCNNLLDTTKNLFCNYENDNDTLVKNLDDDKLFFVNDIVEYEDIIEIFAKEYIKGEF